MTNILRSEIMEDAMVFDQHSNAQTVAEDVFEMYNDYYKFGCTRNPWDRILSWYSLIYRNREKSLDEERKRLEEFIENDHALDPNNRFFHYNALDYFTNEQGVCIADKIFRFERLNSEIRTIADQFNIALTEIPLVNETPPKDYREYYTDKSRMLIEQKCEKDIEHFGYTFYH